MELSWRVYQSEKEKNMLASGFRLSLGEEIVFVKRILDKSIG